ncbi:hypothetical protein SNE40_016332 [Patella caerulea]|uniref:EF-hand domain-containing protein n=1 Tax=Patella caerulea TaxID=87958 RepID=A0AAN8JDY6_PATCE
MKLGFTLLIVVVLVALMSMPTESWRRRRSWRGRRAWERVKPVVVPAAIKYGVGLVGRSTEIDLISLAKSLDLDPQSPEFALIVASLDADGDGIITPEELKLSQTLK